MHDDDKPISPEPEEQEGYWTEARWERFMLENEKLMDRYEQVWKDNPDRQWHDPLDLYYKVHYDLDLGEDPEPDPNTDEESTDPEGPRQEAILPEEPAEHDPNDDFRNIPAYHLAFAFANAVLDYLKRFDSRSRTQDSLRDELTRHALRIAADIAGGHGLGYDEDALCGNIVKNRWARGHAQEAQRLVRALLERDGPDPQLTALLSQTNPMIKALEERIAQLRAKVWWGK